MLYAIINPSDDLTFEAPDLEVAALSIFLLSNGQYGADCQEDGVRDADVPIFLMGGAQAWWGARFTQSIEEAIKARAADIATALDSLVYGSVADRAAFDAMQSSLETDAERRAHAEDWADRKRSSDADIAGTAAEIAANLRRLYAEASPQVPA